MVSDTVTVIRSSSSSTSLQSVSSANHLQPASPSLYHAHHNISIKSTSTSYLFWHTQLLPFFCDQNLQGLVDGSTLVLLHMSQPKDLKMLYLILPSRNGATRSINSQSAYLLSPQRATANSHRFKHCQGRLGCPGSSSLVTPPTPGLSTFIRNSKI